MVDFGLRGGKRRRVCFASEREAQAAAREDGRERAAIGAQGWGRLGVKGRAEVIRLLAEIEQAGLTLGKVWEGYQREASRMGVECKPLGEAVASFLEAKTAANRRPAYLKSLRGCLRSFIRGRESLAVHQITSADVETWFAARTEAAVTKCGTLRRLSAFFNWSKRRGWLRDNPCGVVERPTIERRPAVIFSVAQVKACLRFLQAERPEFLACFALMVFGGIRPDELSRLGWDSINLELGTVTVDAAASKVRLRRMVHLQPVAVAWLRLGRAGKLPWDRDPRMRVFRRLRGVLGLAQWPADVLRHTAASFLLVELQDAGQVALELGNSSDILFRHYRELVTKEQAREFWALTPDAVGQ